MKVDFRTTVFSNKNSKLNGQTKSIQVSNSLINFSAKEKATKSLGEGIKEFFWALRKAAFDAYKKNPNDKTKKNWLNAVEVEMEKTA